MAKPFYTHVRLLLHRPPRTPSKHPRLSWSQYIFEPLPRMLLLTIVEVLLGTQERGSFQGKRFTRILKVVRSSARQNHNLRGPRYRLQAKFSGRVRLLYLGSVKISFWGVRIGSLLTLDSSSSKHIRGNPVRLLVAISLFSSPSVLIFTLLPLIAFWRGFISRGAQGSLQNYSDPIEESWAEVDHM